MVHVLARTWKPFPYANKDIYDAKSTLMVSSQSYFLTKSFFIIFYKINVTVFCKRLTALLETVGFIFILLLFFEERLKKEAKQRKHVSMLVHFDIFMNCVHFWNPLSRYVETEAYFLSKFCVAWLLTSDFRTLFSS